MSPATRLASGDGSVARSRIQTPNIASRRAIRWQAGSGSRGAPHGSARRKKSQTCRQRPHRRRPADHHETVLMAVRPGQKDHPGREIPCRRAKDQPHRRQAPITGAVMSVSIRPGRTPWTAIASGPSRTGQRLGHHRRRHPVKEVGRNALVAVQRAGHGPDLAIGKAARHVADLNRGVRQEHRVTIETIR